MVSGHLCHVNQSGDQCILGYSGKISIPLGRGGGGTFPAREETCDVRCDAVKTAVSLAARVDVVQSA
ncbi:hypothetical protein KC19_VG302300 [Ceratodon purpureus]|uniref:Uncharacterized protein n=1 Tax=Ceratodon purpureus TaxID=3225 RepID=A0A8T0HV81_CERPU|nr:hypothetical protein KC19_VG302300 [Ceratodon purpureus]